MNNKTVIYYDPFKGIDPLVINRCVERIINTIKHVDTLPDVLLTKVTKKRADKRHTNKSKTLDEELDKILDDFGVEVYNSSMCAIYNNLKND